MVCILGLSAGPASAAIPAPAAGIGAPSPVGPLRAVAGVTRGLLRGSDHVARFGGEEFLLLLPDTGTGDAAVVAEKLRARIDELEIAGLDAGITASFGVAVHPDHGLGAGELFAAADAALYEAKENGRDRVEVSGGRWLEPVPAGQTAA